MNGEVITIDVDVNYQSCTSIKDIIAKIDAILVVLYGTALKSAAKGDKVEVSLDDGQSKTKVVYASTDSVYNAINNYEKLRAKHVYRLNGGHYMNIDGRNLRNRRNGC